MLPSSNLFSWMKTLQTKSVLRMKFSDNMIRTVFPLILTEIVHTVSVIHVSIYLHVVKTSVCQLNKALVVLVTLDSLWVQLNVQH